jgi:phosphate transport system protein
MMVDRQFDDELNNLNANLIKMATMAEESIYKAVEALKNRDRELAEKVIEDDQKVDEMELAIDEMAIDLLAIRQPVASDLRFVVVAVKINTELERISDLAVNICQRMMQIMDLPELKPLIDIPKLSEMARKMVKGAIDAFVTRDIEAAKEIILMDPKVNELKNAIQDELVNDYMVKDGKTSPRAVQLLLVARHLERICDHATNIAEDVIYMVDATVARHRKLSEIEEE